MVIKKDNAQVYVTLPKGVVQKIDEDAKREVRTRSKQIAKIVMDHYEKKKEDETNGKGDSQK